MVGGAACVNKQTANLREREQRHVERRVVGRDAGQRRDDELRAGDDLESSWGAGVPMTVKA
jgi:hypothetical protein